MCDELGDLDLELAPMRAKLKRADAIRLAIRETYADDLPGGHYSVHGERWTVLIGAKGNESVVNIPALYKLAGPKLFLEVVSASIKAITEKCGAAVLGACVSTRMTGTRSLALMAKAPGVKCSAV